MEESKYKYKPNGLRKYRCHSRLSQAEVSKLLGFKTTANLSRWEEGVRFPSLINTIKLAGIYHVYVDALYKDLIEDIKEEMTHALARMEEVRVTVNDTSSTPEISP